MLLEVPLVLGRTAEGKAFAMRDSCPHRGIPLSYGRLDGVVVECCYHGWRFDACSGQCVEIPSLSSQDKLKVERIFAGHFPCEERDRSEEHTSELQSRRDLVCRLLLEKKKKKT